MRPIQRGLALAALGMVLLGVLGCNEDNEKGANIQSTPPPAGAQAPPRSEKEYAERAGGQSKNVYQQGGGYGGAKR